MVRVLYHMISYILNDKKVNHAIWLICKLTEIRLEEFEIVFAMIITFIVLKLLTFDNGDKDFLKKFKATY